MRDEIAPYFAERWQRLADHPLVGEARSAGLVGAIELVSDKATRARFPADKSVGETCRDTSVEQGLVMRHVRDSMIVAPPLVITRAQLDELVDKARRALDITARQDGRRHDPPGAGALETGYPIPGISPPPAD